MKPGKGKQANVGVVIMLAAMFIVLGITVSRGFLVIGITFLVIGMMSIGRERVRYFDELEEHINREQADENVEVRVDEQIHED